MQVTYSIAMAAGKDAADRAMRKAGRTSWSRTDYNLACKTVERLMKFGGLLPMLNRPLSKTVVSQL